MTRQTSTVTRNIPVSFLGLQKKFLQLRPIHSKAEYTEALNIASDLASRKDLNHAQADYLRVLTHNIKAYEDEHFESGKHTPCEILRFLVSENRMSGSDLGRVLGHRTLGPKILNGERQLSKRHIKVLAEYFSVDPSLFL
jgi:antitoxin component HigA of HigAB toxin-antitoxin module